MVKLFFQCLWDNITRGPLQFIIRSAINSFSVFYALSVLIAFLMGVILFVSFGKDWLDLDSLIVFLAGLAGIAFMAILVRAWELHRHSHNDKQ